MEQFAMNSASENDERRLTRDPADDWRRIWTWNATVPASVERCVHDMIAETARRQPEAQAVCAWDGDLTYADLETLSTRLAYHLVGLRVGPGAVVPLCFEKSKWTIVAMLAVMKAGAASVLLDTTQPEERLRKVVQQVGPACVVASAANEGLAKRLQPIATVVSVDNTSLSQPIPEHELPPVSPSDRLYVVFTSGSTGTPKGAIITHSNFSSALEHQNRGLGFTATSRVYDYVSYAFDVAWGNALHTLYAGGCLCVPNESDRMGDIARSMRQLQATFIDMTPTVAALINPLDVPNLDTVLFIGEVLTLVEACRWKHVRLLLNTYGPAECTVTATMGLLREGSMAGDPTVGTGIGAPTWVVDAADYEQLLPVGDIGELLIEGPLVGQGYLNDEVKTAAAFIEDPAWLVKGGPGVPGRRGRLYKTGDLVRYGTNGNLQFVGRKDTQVKIRGQRVELGDVEHHVKQNLAASGSVRVVAEVVKPRGSDQAILVAFIEAAEETMRQMTADTRNKLEATVPAYMIPSAYIPLASVPMTATGKTDRRQLRDMACSLSLEELAMLQPLREEHVQPTTEAERQMQGLWATVLNIAANSIGSHDSFLRIGGDSVAAMRLVGAAREQGIGLTVADVFRQPRLKDLATAVVRIETRTGDGIGAGGAELVPPFSLLRPEIDPAEARVQAARLCGVKASQVEDIFPCTPLQEGLLAMTAKRAGQYISTKLIVLRSDVDLARLRQAMTSVVSSTPTLRTRIVDVPGQGLVQVVIDESALSAPDYEQDEKEEATVPQMGLGTSLHHWEIVSSQFKGGHEHVLVCYIHHALYDGWSMPLVLRLLEETYNKNEPCISPPEFQAFVKHVIGIDSKQAAVFWESQLAGSEAVSFPPLPSASYQPLADSTITHQIAKLQWLNNDITASTALRTAWALLAAKYTGSSEAIFGATVTGRQAAVGGVESMAGPTIATVPVRVRLNMQDTVNGTLQQVQMQAVDMTMFEQMGLSWIRRISPDVEQGGQFQTLLVIQPADKNHPDLDTGIFMPPSAGQGSDTGLTELDLFNTYAIMVVCSLQLGGVQLSISFDSSLISDGQVKQMAGQLEHILRELCTPTSGGKKLCEIETTSKQDLEEIWSWNEILPEKVDRCVHDMIAETIERQPNHPAICAWDGDLTYAELDTLSTWLAYHLVDLGVSGTIVPVCFEKSMWTTVAILSVMKAGAASLLLDSTQPEERLQMILRQTTPQCILSSTSKFALVKRIESGATVVLVDHEHLGQLQPTLSQDLPHSSPSSTLCVVFTSGSTGTPKGSISTHSNFSSALKHQGASFGFKPSSRVYDFASYAFDAAWLVLHILFSGATLCVPSDEDRRNDLSGSICRLRATNIVITPKAAELLNARALSMLDTILLAGEATAPKQLKFLQECVAVQLAYGPSECSIMSTMVHDTRSASTIGKGVGVCTWVVDDQTNSLAPIGALGELWIEGPLVGDGYLNEAEKTAAAFIEDPPWLVRGKRWDADQSGMSGRRGRLYKTGDLVRYNGDGSLRFIGRKDTQVKIRGQRVELSEVEHHILANLASDGGEQTSVIVEAITPQGSETSMLIAFVVPNGFAKTTIEQDKEHIKSAVERMTLGLDERLANVVPVYMIPGAYVPLGAVPITATGKTDRRRLRQIGSMLTLEEMASLQPSRAERARPNTAQERHLQQLWARVLNVNEESIELDDSFLRIGGDSVAAMRLVGVAREEGLSLTVADIFQQPRLRDLASRVLLTGSDGSTEEAVAPFSLLKKGMTEEAVRLEAAALCGISANEVEDVFPCTALQEGLLALTAKRAGDYVLTQKLNLDAAVDISRFERAIDAMVALTPTLRTRIIDLPGQGLVQVVVDKAAQLPQDEGSEEAELGSEQQEDQQRMGLGTPLQHWKLSRTSSSRKWLFVWSLHHAIYDGWAMSLLLHALEKVYGGSKHTEPPAFQRFIKNVMSIDNKQAAAFWLSQLANSEAVPFPALPGTSYKPQTDSLIERDVSALVWRKDNITPSTVLRTAWAMLAARWTGASNEALFGATVTGRQAPVWGVEQMTGPTVATVPVRVTIQAEMPVNEMLQQVQSQAIDMAAFEQMGLRQIRRISPETERGSQFQTLLVIQPSSDDGPEPGGSLFSTRQLEETSARVSRLDNFSTYAMTVMCQLATDGLHLQISFDSKVVSSNQVERMAALFEHIIRQLCPSPLQGTATKVSDIQTITEQDLGEIWEQNAVVPTTVTRCVHDLIADTVKTRPSSLAISAWDGNLTYSDLDSLSTNLAHHLVDLGVRPGSIVPLCFEKSMWTTVAIMSVMKSGAASLLLDSTQPEERLRTIAQQVAPTHILTSTANNALANRLLTGVPVVTIDHASMSQLLPHSERSFPETNPSDKLYVVFTSGSTGTPKGALITHSNFSSALVHQKSTLGLSEISRVYDFSSYAFDAAWFNLLHTLYAGGCLCVPLESDRRDDLSGSIHRLGATHLTITPSAAELLDTSALEGLNTVLLVGEASRSDQVLHLRESTTVQFAYGPSECSIMSTISSEIVNAPSIGHASGIRAWVVDSQSGDFLVPMGAIGELWVEGPLVGQGYLNEPKKTAAVFIEDPAWLLRGGPNVPGRRGRLYKTGDIVRYGTDGTLHFVGRKDTQVKLRGQRLELGEVEHHVHAHLAVDKNVQVSIVVEVITLKDSNASTLAAFIALVGTTTTADTALVQAMTRGLDEKLADILPAYMIPSAYIPLAAIPMMAAGKTDRRRLREMGSSLSLENLRATITTERNEIEEPADQIEHILRSVWSTTLNIPEQSISVVSRFTRIGGDSISAMQVVSRCRVQNWTVTVSDILRHQTIREVAKRCKTVQHQSQDDCQGEEEDLNNSSAWPLSPIQKMYLDAHPVSHNHFNQSFILQTRARLAPEQLRQAMQAVVGRHNMLRTRFRRDDHGNWEQFVANQVPQEIDTLTTTHVLHSVGDMAAIAQHRQGTLDIKQGPVFTLDVFDVADSPQILLLTAHHLVIDLMSWRVIWHDMQETIRGREIPGTAVSFRRWCKAQQHASQKQKPADLLPFVLQPARLDYWDVEPGLNESHDYEHLQGQLSTEITELLLGKSNDAFQTETVDILLAVLVSSFQAIFTDREVPAIYLEGHGREQIDDLAIDVSETVGWFTTLHPLQLPVSDITPIGDMLRVAKDIRRQVPGKGRPYFASQCYSTGKPGAIENREDIEVILNYTGLFQQLESEDSIFVQPTGEASLIELVESSPMIQRFGLVEVNIEVRQGSMVIHFDINKRMKHQSKLRQWFGLLVTGLSDASRELASCPTRASLYDFPLLQISYAGLDDLLDRRLPQDGIAAYHVADLYPCTPLQEGILLSRSRGLPVYANHWVWSCTINNSDLAEKAVSSQKLTVAWESTIKRHSVFSTVFSENPDTGDFIQVLLKGHAAKVKSISTESSPEEVLRTLEVSPFALHEPQYAVTICESERGTIACRLDMNHALFDAASMPSLLNDVVTAYGGVTLAPAPQFREAVEQIAQVPTAQRQQYWTTFLKDASPCLFPADLSQTSVQGRKEYGVLEIRHRRSTGIYDFCAQRGITRSSFLHVAWALALSQFTGTEDIYFGYLASGRDLPLDGIHEIVGPLINMLICRVDLTRGLTDTLNAATEQSIEHLVHQHVSLGRLQHDLGLGGKQLFNTGMTVRDAYEAPNDSTGLQLVVVQSKDPHELDLLLAVELSGSTTQLMLSYCSDVISEQTADAMGEALESAIHFLMEDQAIQQETPQQGLGQQFSQIRLDSDGDAARRRQQSQPLAFSALQSSTDQPQASPTEQVQPRTEAERQLQQLWASVLRIDENSIGVYDSFLRIGGDSIAAMRLVGAARKQGLWITVAQILQRPRLCDLAASMSRIGDNEAAGRGTDSGAGGIAETSTVTPFSLLQRDLDPEEARAEAARLCGVTACQVEDVFPCTPLQEGLLAMTARQAGSYISTQILEIRDTVDVERLERALDAVVSTVPSLRTRVIDLPGQGLVQVVIDKAVHQRKLDALDEKEQNIGLGTPLQRWKLVRKQDGGPWVLTWSMHHAVYDGWSIPLLLQAVEEAYEQNWEAPPAPPPFQRFVKYITEIDETQAASFWESQLADAEAVPFPALPSISYKPRTDSVISYDINGLEWQKDDFTASTVLRMALAVLIARYTGLSEAILGVTVTGRQAPVLDVERMMGPTIATVPVRVKVDSRGTVNGMLRQVQDQTIAMTAFEQLGLQRIRRMSPEVERGSHFQTLLVVQPAEQEALEARDGLFSPQATDNSIADADEIDGFSTYAMMVVCQLKARGLHLQISFDSNVLDHRLVERMASQFENVLQQVCAPDNKTMTMGDIETISEGELSEIWNRNSMVPETIERCVHDMIGETVQRQPGALAICAWDGEMTYNELDTLSTRLAHELVKIGAGPGKIIPLCFEKSKWMAVGILAVMKAGAVSLMLESTQPEERLRTIVKQVGASQILSSAANEGLARRLEPSATVTVPYYANLHLLETPLGDDLPLCKPSDNLYIVFTSGSTGTPKGAIISHSNFSSALKHQANATRLSRSDRVYDFASYAFDVAWFNVLHTLYAGATLCVPSDNDRSNDISGSICRLQATYVCTTPKVAELLDTEALRVLDTLTLGGESATVAQILRLQESTTVQFAYGPSECSITSTLSTDTSSVSNIGSSVGVCTWVVDNESGNSLVPIGATGELWIEGPLVGQGYLNEPSKTAAAFVEDPPWLLRGGSGVPGRRGRLYKTGDLVQYKADGTLRFIGRKDGQVKIRGQRVELGEVEHHVENYIQTHVAADIAAPVSVVAEVITPYGTSTAMLVAFIVSDGVTAQADMKEMVRNATMGLGQRLAEVLPAYMIPAAYIPLTTAPMTATGKTDRRRLREIGSSLTLEEVAVLQPSRGRQVKPRTEGELQLQQLWSRVLNIDGDTIGIDDSFLRIGGDSIRAMQLVGAARELGLGLTVADIFQHPHLSDLASVLSTNSGSYDEPAPFSLVCGAGRFRASVLKEVSAALDDVPVEHIVDVFPATSWQVACLESVNGRCHYFYMDLPESSDVKAVRQTCQRLFESVDGLRTTFIRSNSGHLQVVLAGCELPITVSSTNDDISASSAKIYDEDRHSIRPLGSLMTRFFITLSSGGQIRLTMRISHAQYDGFSIQRMAEYFAGDDIDINTPALHSFSGYVRHNMLRQDEALQYWRDVLGDSQLTKLPHRRSSNESEPLVGKLLQIKQTVSRPSHLPNVTAASVFIAACARAFSRVVQSQDVVFGLLVSGRSTLPPDIQDVIGPCVNVIPVRYQFEEGSTFLESCESIQTQCTASRSFETTDFKDIAEKCTKWPKATKTYGCAIQYQDIHDVSTSPIARADVRFNVYDEEILVANDTIGIFALPREDAWEIEVHGNDAYYDQSALTVLLNKVVECVSMAPVRPKISNCGLLDTQNHILAQEYGCK